jgi:uncharacterized protein (TIGR02246 family)
MQSYHRSIVHFCFSLVLSAGSMLDSTARGAESPEAIAQIRETSNSYVEALNRGDPEAIASFWTPQGTFVDADDNTHQAQELARQEFSKEVVSQEERTVTEHQSTFRLITPDVAIERGSTGPQQSGRQRGPETGYIAIWVKTDERWLLDYLKELNIPPRPQEVPLDELGWMVGTWDSQAKGISARLIVSWSDQKRFLIQRFTVQLPDQDEIRGVQRIAWDPSSKQIRSWLFRSDGGFVEGVWNREGDSWVVKRVGVLPNGEKTTTVSLWVHEDSNTCWFKSLNAQVGDLKVDDLVLQFTRTNSP